MNSHTPEPWRAEGAVIYSGCSPIVEVSPLENESEDIANLERIVACVNACAGIPTNALLNGIIKKMITACKAIEDNWESGDLAAAARLCSQVIKDLEKEE